MAKLDERGVNGGDVRCRLPPAEYAAGNKRLRLGRLKLRYVTEVTSRHHGLRYGELRMWIEEVAMAAALKRTGTRFARWFEEFRRQNRPAHKWYEHDLYCG